MHLVLTGATGLVGSAALHAAIRNTAITKVSIISRREVPLATASAESKEKCRVIIHKDFAQPLSDEILATLSGASGCVWALGISQNEVTKAKYTEITIDYPLIAAKALASVNTTFNFVYVSGEGATTNPGFMTPFFGSTKGIAEASLLELSKHQQYAGLNVYSARPAMIDNISHPEIHGFSRERSDMAFMFVKALGPIIRMASKASVSPTKELGAVLVQLAAGNGEPIVEGAGVSGDGRTLANVALRRMAGL